MGYNAVSNPDLKDEFNKLIEKEDYRFKTINRKFDFLRIQDSKEIPESI